MVLSKPFRDSQLNHSKFALFVWDELPKALRQTFKLMWDTKFGPGQPWDDSDAVRKLFRAKEGGKLCKVPTKQSYEEWDCTALFKATIFAQSFALPDSKGNLTTLNDLYVKPRGSVPRGSFHASVMSPSGNNAETFALAIDQLRLQRNSLCHSTNSVMDKITFDQYMKHAKDAFKALGVVTDSIDAVGSMPESHFPTEEVATLKRKIRNLRLVLFD